MVLLAAMLTLLAALGLRRRAASSVAGHATGKEVP
jgi:hypothetical protein